MDGRFRSDRPLVSDRSQSPPVPADGFVDNKYASASVTLDADLGFAQLTVIPAYRWQQSAFFTRPPAHSISPSRITCIRRASKPGWRATPMR